jgi:hypothetical protein
VGTYPIYIINVLTVTYEHLTVLVFCGVAFRDYIVFNTSVRVMQKLSAKSKGIIIINNSYFMHLIANYEPIMSSTVYNYY